MNENIELNGVVTKFDYVNPHSWLEFDVSTDGKSSSLRDALATTLRPGWTQEMLAAGTKITVQGSPDRMIRRLLREHARLGDSADASGASRRSRQPSARRAPRQR